MTADDRLALPAPAKLNLFLHVTGRRADGYHLLETVFRFVDLADHIVLSRRDDGLIVREGGLDEVAPEDDLVVRAAHALREATGCRLGATIALDKRIPAGAGLGGGSSDAATVLLGLNRLWRLGLTRDRLMAIGVRLGADVPVFVFGRNAYATGIGEVLAPVPLPPQWFVLAMPSVAVSTASVFGAPDLTRNTEPITLAGFSSQVANGGATALVGRNDLEPVVFARQPAVREAHRLLEMAATREAPSGVGVAGLGKDVRHPVRARMTGSGACVFAVADSESRAHAIADAFTALESERRKAASSTALDDVSPPGTAPSRVFVAAGLQEHPLGSSQVG
ncbi:MAG: 4-(cytidine 5'-diphospho)-2-C-methyl-D-erythritol kinase [Lautropia sp.]